MRNLSWFQQGTGASREAVSELESTLGTRLPDDYVKFVMQFAGADNPKESEFDVSSEGGTFVGNFGEVLQISPENGRCIHEVIADLAEQLPLGVVPIIATGSGDYVCLDLRNKLASSIAYFSHEKEVSKSTTELSPSLSGFLDSLRVPDSDE